MRIQALFPCIAATLLVATQPARAQLDGGLAQAIAAKVFNVATPESCMSGHNPFAAGTTLRILGMSEIALRNYVRLASSGERADVRPAYSTKKVKLAWSRDGQIGDFSALDDPLARLIGPDANGFDQHLKKESFLIAGDKRSTMGLWRIIASDDPKKTLGWYRVRFWRHNTLGGQTWDLMNMEVTTGATAPAKVTQYCREPGDVEQYLAEQKAMESERARKRAAGRSVARP